MSKLHFIENNEKVNYKYYEEKIISVYFSAIKSTVKLYKKMPHSNKMERVHIDQILQGKF